MSRFEKILAYFASEKGKKFTFRSVGVVMISSFCVQYLPNTIFIEKFKEVLEAYRLRTDVLGDTNSKYGIAKEVPDKIYRRFELAMEICKCDKYERAYLKPFIVYGFDTIDLGSTKSRFNGYVGVPTNYLYDTQNQIEKNIIKLRGEEIKWRTEDGERLEKSLVLTEDEQIFGIARSILQVTSHKVLLSSLYAPLTILSMYATGQYINKTQNYFARPLVLRLGVYTLLGLFGFGTYAFARDFTQMYYDKAVDQKLAEVGPEFVEAGVRFYDKLLQKNIAVRNLIGDNNYSAKGNENYLLRQKSLPLTARKSYFEKRLQELLADGSNSDKPQQNNKEAAA